jgi:hypothetical protein
MSNLVPGLKPGLTPAEFGQLADVPPELAWLANLTNPLVALLHYPKFILWPGSQCISPSPSHQFFDN